MGNYSVGQIALFAVVLAGVIAVVYIAITAMGVPIPSWVVSILWVIGVVLLAALAIKVIISIGNDPKP